MFGWTYLRSETKTRQERNTICEYFTAISYVILSSCLVKKPIGKIKLPEERAYGSIVCVSWARNASVVLCPGHPNNKKKVPSIHLSAPCRLKLL